ncbi:S-adenosyl-L-methionine-dependent methyltransferase [Exophiala viscosa]|uniref:S-adenosyl-L-methionine-dependent methyltransferase n=1 Tax=Exophiala viscosa TaxID=2486360 RepID=A0AAN6E551_9EURO|nr:S-adenosyl-L-methionine-dependent methyltransferase [Exophiala viscosa]KAI1627400.1 S-adenosyl-L-methionine-dependent methyltransferase [Exophiala viscosa]
MDTLDLRAGMESAVNSVIIPTAPTLPGPSSILFYHLYKGYKMSTKSHDPKEEQWTAKKYAAAASFVPQLTQKLVQYLDPQPTDRILDVGCGDGKFTSNFLTKAACVYGVDASSSFIESARTDYGSKTATFKVVDCRYLEKDAEVMNGTWDKVVSNAALQYILRDPPTRINTLKACFNALKPGGQFVFEMGGAGNVSEAAAAMTSALYHSGLAIDQARDASPWFFPSQKWMEDTLARIGFHVEKLEVEYRPTKLDEGPGGGLEGWIKLICGSMLEAVEEEKRDGVVWEACEVLKDVITREDGSQWLGFVRLRGVARKPR